MVVARDDTRADHEGRGSFLSVALCDSFASVLLCL
jgi:hypothetical protein